MSPVAPFCSKSVLLPVALICGLVPPKTKLPDVSTGIWFPVADWAGVNPPTVLALMAKPDEATRWRGERFSKLPQTPPLLVATATFK